jgi:hypothetical protein
MTDRHLQDSIIELPNGLDRPSGIETPQSILSLAGNHNLIGSYKLLKSATHPHVSSNKTYLPHTGLETHIRLKSGHLNYWETYRHRRC